MIALNRTTMWMTLVAFGIASAASADPVPALTIEPSLATIQTGDTLTLGVMVRDVTDLFAFQFDIGFDPGVLTATAITEGSFLSSAGFTFFVPGLIDNSTGTISFTANTILGPGPGVSGSGTLAWMDFTAIGAGASSVTLSNVLLLDANLSPIDFTTAIGTVAVAAVPEPTGAFVLAALLVLSIAGHKRTRRG